MVDDHQRIAIVRKIFEVRGFEALIALDRKVIRRGLDRRDVPFRLLVDEIGVVGLHEVAVFAARPDDGRHRELDLGILAKFNIARALVAQQEERGNADDGDNEDHGGDDKRGLLFLSRRRWSRRRDIGSGSGFGYGGRDIGTRLGIGGRICGRGHGNRNGCIEGIVSRSARRRISLIVDSNRSAAFAAKTSIVAQLIPTFRTKHRDLPSQSAIRG